MSSYRQILLHIIFRTKFSGNTIPLKYEHELFKYIFGFLKQKNIKLFRINAHSNHIHMLTDQNPSIALADYLRDLKTSSSKWLKQNSHFPIFEGWADGYAALSYSNKNKDILIQYIKSQKEHHKKLTFEEELKQLLQENGIEIDERYFP